MDDSKRSYLNCQSLSSGKAADERMLRLSQAIAATAAECERILMTIPRQPFPWPLFLSAAIVALVAGYAIGKHASLIPQNGAVEVVHGDRFTDFAGSRAQAEDAFRRWAQKTHDTSTRVRQIWSPVLMAFPTKNCIQLMIEPPGVGGEPIYCYRRNSLDLIEEYSDVQ
jgi:hypothetical protein